MSLVYEIGEFVKVLNHFLTTGEVTEISVADMPVCPKCHRHLLKGMSVCTYCVKKTYVFGRAFTYFKPYMKKVVFATLLLTAANVLDAVLPLFNSLLLDNYLVPKDGATPYFSSKTTGIDSVKV